ncbi:PSD1 and planctomycete cytochrome C domain-containing protein [Akkermansiaceae bacterium]|nr:PSD1 and planctomycete cytochrome C domain-containing protein [Akkermansiaceae bacterium]MDA7888419.1 PSD1 and planctomycete cytochrome C domain-containing protein [Akkermansiaceae bacterium]MDB4544645.1 PSD1 and planctomycete cytochrome C domain-containing protein [Akkermansiaceae bacterium]
MRISFLSLLLITPLMGKIDFATQVQPILSENCYACHGPDQETVESGLRLDKRELALKGGDSGEAFVPGDAEKSLLIERITSDDDDELMPPRKKKDPLTADQISILKQWINEGAEWGEHWAFIPPTRPALPEVTQKGWVKNPIDHFVLAKLEADGLAPSKKADPRTLLRRRSLDLIGLPPTLEQLKTPDAITNKELLASPHFGEKWARDWLDVARYADSSGYEKDLPRQMHFYRDWVIKALNDDMGYDQFIINQIAGDLLPDANQDNIVATGYLRNSMTNEEGGAKPEQFRVEGLFDRMDAIGKGVLGITTQCAQCHTHKYDPLSHDEYFGMFAYLNSIRETSYPAYNEADQKRIEEIHSKIANLEDDLKNSHPDWQKEFQQWQADLLALPRTKWVVQDIAQIGDDGQKYQNLPDGSLINQGYAATKSTAPFAHETRMKTIRSVRLELLNDPYLAFSGPGRSIEGTAALSGFRLLAGPTPDKLTPVKLQNAVASVNPPDSPLNQSRHPIDAKGSKDERVTGGAAYAIDGNIKTAWTTDQGYGRSNAPQAITFELAEPLANPGSLHMKTLLDQRHGGFNSDDNQNFNVGKFRMSFSSELPNNLDQLPILVLQALTANKRTKEQEDLLFSHWRESQEHYATINAQTEALWKQHPKPALALVAKKIASPRDTRLFERGEQTHPKHVVRPHVPAFLHPLPEGADSTSRLTFAKWLVDKNSPTTARTLVNRIWQSYFGHGIVDTPEDLGLQSPQPSHPKLLDWLAVELMENDWSMKHIHELITSSATYQQSSVQESLHRERDPNNRLLARGPRTRVPAETIRDIHLSVSGLLDDTMGGRSVYPPAPAFLFQKPVSYGPKTWPIEQDSNRYRRGIYTFRFRSVVYPMLLAFDAPTGEASCVRRINSTTPLQALVTLNEPISVEAAVGLGHRILSTQDGIASAFERCTSRPPDKSELETLQVLFENQEAHYSKNKEAAKELTTIYKPVTIDISKHDPVKLAAATALGQALLNLDETISKN